MVPLRWRSGLAPASRSGRKLQEVANLAVRPPFGKQATQVWAGLLWSMALVGLFLLPSNFHGGSDVRHGHSLLQLWADAADGHVDHHRHQQTDAPVMDWLDPSTDVVAAAQSGPDQDGIDVGDHDDSAPAAGIVLLLPAALSALVAVVGVRLPSFHKEHVLVGCCPDVLLPPPR